LAVELKHPFSVAFAWCWWADLSRFLRDARSTLEQADTALALATEQKFPIWAAKATILRGWALSMQQEPERGASELAKGIAAWRATGAGSWVHTYYAMEAEALALLGKAKEALQKLDAAQAVMEKTEERWWEAEIYRLRGALLLQCPKAKRAEAETWLRRALDVARRQQAKSLELRAATSLARLWRDQGKVAEARDLLGPIHGWFTEGFGTPDLKEAGGLLEQLAGKRRRQ
jgi:predicted ATPase